MISLSFLLLLFVGVIILFGTSVHSAAGKKLWLIPATAAVVFLGFIATGLTVSIAVPHAASVATVETMPQSGFAGGVASASHIVARAPNFVAASPAWYKVMFVFVLGASFVAIVLRRIVAPHTSHGWHRAWPGVVVLLFVAMLFFGRLWSGTRIVQSSAEVAPPRVAAAPRKASDAARAKKQAPPADIQAEMDQFDAPRIPLAPPAPISPASPEVVAESAASAETKASKDDAKKTASASNQKRKKSDKKMSSTDTKQSQLASQSKAAQEAVAKKDEKTSNEKPVMVAEADTDRPKVRPVWIDAAPQRSGNTRREVIATDEYASADECYQAADIYLLLKAYQRMQQLAGRHDVSGPLPSLTFNDGKISADGTVIFSRGYWDDERLYHLNSLGINADYLRTIVVAKDPKNNEPREFVDTVDRSIGPMKKLYLQVEFTPSVDRDLQRHWDAYERQERFAKVGLGAGSVLGLLGIAFTLLKIDTATKGYYSKRLFVGVPLAILGMFGLYAMLVVMGAKLPH